MDGSRCCQARSQSSRVRGAFLAHSTVRRNRWNASPIEPGGKPYWNCSLSAHRRNRRAWPAPTDAPMSRRWPKQMARLCRNSRAGSRKLAFPFLAANIRGL
jgi:hypothetical protein